MDLLNVAFGFDRDPKPGNPRFILPEDYPHVEWHSRIGAVASKGDGLSVETKELFTLRTAKTVGLKDAEVRFFDRAQGASSLRESSIRPPKSKQIIHL